MTMVLTDMTVPMAAVSTLCREYISELDTAKIRYVQQMTRR